MMHWGLRHARVRSTVDAILQGRFMFTLPLP